MFDVGYGRAAFFLLGLLRGRCRVPLSLCREESPLGFVFSAGEGEGEWAREREGGVEADGRSS